MRLRLRFFLWLGTFLPLHGPVSQFADTAICQPTGLGIILARVLRLTPRVVEWDVGLLEDTHPASPGVRGLQT